MLSKSIYALKNALRIDIRPSHFDEQKVLIFFPKLSCDYHRAIFFKIKKVFIIQTHISEKDLQFENKNAHITIYLLFSLAGKLDILFKLKGIPFKEDKV